MKITDKYDKLLKFMYDEYDRSRGRSEYVQVMVSRFERQSQDNRFGSANNKVAAVAYLHDNGWIEIEDVNRRKLSGLDAYYGRMKPTPKGTEYLKQRQIYSITRITSPLAEFLGKLGKGFFGK